jgi:RHS repeat-associated protein
LGSIIALTDETGTIRTQYNYSPYGETVLIGEASDNPFQYTGRENDGTGLYAYRLRYYSPEMRSFISEDPIRFAGGMNWYSYVGNRPVNLVDPLGLHLWTYSNDNHLLTLYDDDYNAVASVSAVSGVPDNPAAAIPIGKYLLGRLTPIANVPKNAAYCDSAGNCWWVNLVPQFDTNRGTVGGQLGIHPDGNIPGETEGCIGISGNNTLGVYNLLREFIDAPLYVIDGLWDNSL